MTTARGLTVVVVGAWDDDERASGVRVCSRPQKAEQDLETRRAGRELCTAVLKRAPAAFAVVLAASCAPPPNPVTQPATVVRTVAPPSARASGPPPPVTAPPPLEPFALFAVDGSVLVPLYCSDPSGQSLSRWRCNSLVSPGEEVALSDGTTAKVRGPSGVKCVPGEVDPFPVLLLHAPATGSLWAVHPSSARARVHAAAEPSKMSPQEAGAAASFFVSRVTASAEARGLLDGDEFPDTLLAVQAPSNKRGHWLLPGAASRHPVQVESWRPGTPSRLAATLETAHGTAFLLVRPKGWRLYVPQGAAYSFAGGWSCD